MLAIVVAGGFGVDGGYRNGVGGGDSCGRSGGGDSGGVGGGDVGGGGVIGSIGGDDGGGGFRAVTHLFVVVAVMNGFLGTRLWRRNKGIKKKEL